MISAVIYQDGQNVLETWRALEMKTLPFLVNLNGNTQIEQ